MNKAVLLSCLHLVFIVDRVEPPWAIVEWWGTTSTSDVSTALFPARPEEGDLWVIHLSDRGDPDGWFDSESSAYRWPQGSVFLPEDHLPPRFQTTSLRMSRMPNLNSTGGKPR